MESPPVPQQRELLVASDPTTAVITSVALSPLLTAPASRSRLLWLHNRAVPSSGADGSSEPVSARRGGAARALDVRMTRGNVPEVPGSGLDHDVPYIVGILFDPSQKTI